MIQFEDRIEIIDNEIAKRRQRWQLDALAYIDFDDIAQMLRSHIYKKWSLWDQSRPLEQWLSRVITNQIHNHIRNNYGNLAPPCNGCAFNLGADICNHTPSGTKCSECPLFAKWQKTKSKGYYLKLAGSINDENYIEQTHSSVSPEDGVNIKKGVVNLHKKMKEKLTPNQYKIYHQLFVEGKSEDKVAEEMGFKTTERNRRPGYKHISNLKKVFVEKAKKILEEEDIFYDHD